MGEPYNILAIGNLITLLFTSPEELFPIDVFQNHQIASENINWNIFYILGFDNLIWSYIFSIVILATSISGYFPQIICFFQAWVSYSILKGAYISEGGDQITAILTLLLIPICVFDKRINHWHSIDFFTYDRSKYINFFCYSCVIFIQIQMAVLYLDAGVGKILVPEWTDGTAVYYWFNNNLFGAPSWIRYVLGWVFKSNVLTPIITWSIIGLELLLSSAIFMDNKFKKIMFIVAFAFHFIIFLVHGLPAFGCAMLGGLVIFLLPIENKIKFKI